MRKDAREVAFKILFSEIFADKNDDLFSELSAEANLGKDERAFAEKLINTVNEHKEEFDFEISSLAHNYALERVYNTDKCALYIGFAEMKYFDDVPNVVAIDEALTLCRKYSTENSLSFVNGILAKYKNNIENL